MQQQRLRLLDGSAAIVRPVDSRDIPGLFAAVRDSIEHLTPWMPWCHPDFSLEECKTWVEFCPTAWESGNQYNFSIVDGDDSGTVLGGCGLNQFNKEHRFANLGYWVRRTEIQKGIATAATTALANFGFSELALNRLEIVVAIENVASQKVAKKVGARFEGVARNRLIQHNRVLDAHIYSLTPDDLRC